MAAAAAAWRSFHSICGTDHPHWTSAHQCEHDAERQERSINSAKIGMRWRDLFVYDEISRVSVRRMKFEPCVDCWPIIVSGTTVAVVVRRQGVSHTPSGGLIPPTFAQHPSPASGERRERGEEKGEEREGERRRERKGPPPNGWSTPPMFQILKNTLVRRAILFPCLFLAACHFVVCCIFAARCAVVRCLGVCHVTYSQYFFTVWLNHFFPCHTLWQYSNRDPPTRASSASGLRKIAIFDQYLSLLAMIQDRAIRTRTNLSSSLIPTPVSVDDRHEFMPIVSV